MLYLPKASASSTVSGRVTPAGSGRKTPGMEATRPMTPRMMNGAFGEKDDWNRREIMSWPTINYNGPIN